MKFFSIYLQEETFSFLDSVKNIHTIGKYLQNPLNRINKNPCCEVGNQQGIQGKR